MTEMLDGFRAEVHAAIKEPEMTGGRLTRAYGIAVRRAGLLGCKGMQDRRLVDGNDSGVRLCRRFGDHGPAAA